MKLRLSALALELRFWWGVRVPVQISKGVLTVRRVQPHHVQLQLQCIRPVFVRPVAVAWRDYVPQPARNG